MAASALFRGVFWCLVESPGCQRVAGWVAVSAASGGQTYYGSIAKGLLATEERFRHGDHAADIEAHVNALDPPEESPGWVMTDFDAPFELRKLQVRWSRLPSGLPIEDVDVCTFHFIKVSGGVPISWAVDGSDLTTLETALNTWWAAIKIRFNPFTHLDQFRWYHDGPAYYHLNDDGTHYVPNGDNPAVRVTEVDVAGTTASGFNLPPQASMTVTERTSSRHHWGRFYLPAPDYASLSAEGRIAGAMLSTMLGATVTFYNACRAASLIPVVWSIQKPERPKKPSGTLPAAPAKAYEVTSLQMDDLFDVIRSRRYKHSVLKTNTVLT